jgi:imidazolonepropionase-like amidohydrolase
MATVIKGGTIIDGTGNGPFANADLVIDGAKITAISSNGQNGSGAIPEDATIIDATGKYVLPGLINAHTHLCWDCVGDLKEQSHFDPPVMVAFKYAMNLRHCLQAGVTTVRELGSPYDIPLAATQAVNQGIIAGPRIFHSGRPLSITGGHAFWMGTHQVDGPDAVRKAVREELRNGASWIKMMASGSREEGLTNKGTVWTKAFPEFTLDELRAAADEAHAAGKRITAHATETRAIRNCVEAGFDAVEHGGPIEDDVLERMAADEIWIVPTLSPANLQVERGAQIGMPAFEIERRRQQIRTKAENTVRAARAGVPLAMGTDAGSPAVPNHEVVREIELMVELGICETPMEAIVISTHNGAKLLGVDDQIGTLEPGKFADVIVVDRNPLENLAVLRDVHLVFLGGELVARDGIVLK